MKGKFFKLLIIQLKVKLNLNYKMWMQKGGTPRLIQIMYCGYTVLYIYKHIICYIMVILYIVYVQYSMTQKQRE